LETSMFKRRVTLDVSLYKTNTKDLLFSVPQSPSTSYSFSLINAGETQNKGVEVALGIVPIKSSDFQWDINVNWSKNKNTVVALNQGRNNLQLASFQETTLNATVGEAYGTFRGTGFVYDANGNKVVDDDGHYLVATDRVLGNIQADWMGGVYNTFRYKNFSLGFLIDVKKGGSVYSLDQSYGGLTGIYAYSAGLNDLGNPVRNPLTNGPNSGGIILPGVKQDGTPNDVRIDASYAGGAYGTDAGIPQEAFIYDASYVKLREAKISYTLPSDLLKNTFIKGMTLSLLGQNLWIIHKNLPDADPEAGTSSGNIQGFQSGVMPSTRIYSFNVKLDF
ncbi:MAG: SusC/RagA family TonB-linked outer membrane protein, partial [Chryseobacterium sp.]